MGTLWLNRYRPMRSCLRMTTSRFIVRGPLCWHDIMRGVSGGQPLKRRKCRLSGCFSNFISKGGLLYEKVRLALQFVLGLCVEIRRVVPFA